MPKLIIKIMVVALILGIMVAFLPFHNWLRVMIACLTLGLVMQIFMWVINWLNPPPVPTKAIRQLLNACRSSSDDWVIIEFKPKISAEQATQNIGYEITQKERVDGFMFKLNAIAGTNSNLAVCFSENKGIVAGCRPILVQLLDIYGRWMLDTWYSLNGAFIKHNFRSISLDGPIAIRTDRL